MARPIVGSGIGRLPLRVQSGRTVGYADIRLGNTTISDAHGKIISTSQRLGDITKIHSRTGKPLGYAEHVANGERINYFEHLPGGVTRPRGYDLIRGTQVEHYDAIGRYLGRTDLELGSSGAKVLASLVVAAAVVEEIMHEENENEEDLKTQAKLEEQKKKAEEEARPLAARAARLKALFKPNAILTGRQMDGGRIWPFKIQLQAVNGETGDFSGRIEYTSLGSIHAVKGQVVEDSFGYEEVGVIRKGRALPEGTHSFRLLPDGRLTGTWQTVERWYANWGNGRKEQIGGGIPRSGEEIISMPPVRQPDAR